MTESLGLSIGVDRMVGRYFSWVDLNPETIQEFYDNLNIENKRPLTECHIYLSGLYCIDHNSKPIMSVVIKEGNEDRAKDYDPQTPPGTNVIIFMGSISQSKNHEFIYNYKGRLGHELVNFALSGAEGVYEVEKQAAKALCASLPEAALVTVPKIDRPPIFARSVHTRSKNRWADKRHMEESLPKRKS